MGVYIKGMTLGELNDCVMVGAYIAPEDAVEVTEPHGRLIDADKLFGWYDGQRDEYPIKKETPQYGTLMMYEIFDEIDDAPTVIEAEGE